MTVIPDDVWMHIAQFIPEDDLKTLFSVNRAFFHLAMNARYHTVVLRDMDLDTFKLVARLQDVLVAKRVRCLQIRPLQVDWWSHSRAVQDFVAQFTFDSEFEWFDPTLEFLRLATRAIGHMQNVARCTWVLPDKSSSFPLPPNFFQWWSPSCHNLEQLDLHIPSQNLSAARGLASVHFPCLRDVGIFIDDTDWRPPPKQWTVEASPLDILASFISRSHPTLRRLNICITSNLSPSFIGKLGHFTQLTKLELTIPIFAPEVNKEHEITRFITGHAATLEYFAFAALENWLYGIDHLIPAGIRNVFSINPEVKFPRLRTLELNCHGPTSEQGISFATCIQPFVDTITTLVLKDQSLSEGALEIISSAFIHNPRTVTSAWFRLDNISPSIVDLLAERFPSLTDLTLVTMQLSDDEHDLSFGISSEDDFCNAMEGRTYPQWMLRNVTILFSLNCLCNTLSWRAMAAMARSAPSILSFDSQGDMIMPDWPAEFPVEDYIKSRCMCSNSTDWVDWAQWQPFVAD